jgi:5-methylcytosine-specific restriction endonuclease McrA
MWASVLERPTDLIIVAAAAAQTRDALDALHRAELAYAKQLWESVDGPTLHSAWDNQVVAIRNRGLSLRSPAGLAARPEMVQHTTVSKSLSKTIFDRDRYRCRYCDIPVVTEWANGDIAQLITAFPDLTPDVSVVNGALKGGGKRGRLLNCDRQKWLWLTASADHVFPASRGGPTITENLVTACAGCNYGKADWTLEELNVRDPRSTDSVPPLTDHNHLSADV